MSRRYLALLIGLILFGTSASAMGLSGEIILGFSSSYAGSDGSTRTHRGVDVAMAPGAHVESPVSGTVKFAGRVPSAAGGTLLCVTVETDRGVVTLMPLEQMHVSSGDRIDEGQSVGTIAAEGDPSSGQPHLHLGLKKGDVYLDPTALLVAEPVVAAEPEPTAAPVGKTAHEAPPAASPTPVAVVAPAPAEAPAAVTPAGVGAAQGAPVPASSGVPAGQSAIGISGETAPVSQGAAPSTASGSLPAGVTLAEPVQQSSRPLVATGRDSAIRLPVETRQAPATDAASKHMPRASFETGRIAPAVGLLAAALAGGLVLVTRRSLTRRVTAQRTVSDRFGTLLQHLKAGDTLCGLTSCPGPLPSQSRGH